MAFFDLELTIESGQTPTFTWEKVGPQCFKRIASTSEVWLDRGKLQTSPDFSKSALRRLFRLQDDVAAIYARLSEDDSVLDDAVRQYSGLRLTESDPWETTVCFIASQNNHIPRIKQIVRGLHGKSGILKPEELVAAEIGHLKAGYREPFLKQAAAMVAENGFSFDRLRRAGLDEARESLCELPGVGPKVADCILLYGLGRTEAFPADVWVKKAIATWYGVKKENRIFDFAQERWGKDAGYAQQLLFWKARNEL